MVTFSQVWNFLHFLHFFTYIYELKNGVDQPLSCQGGGSGAEAEGGFSLTDKTEDSDRKESSNQVVPENKKHPNWGDHVQHTKKGTKRTDFIGTTVIWTEGHGDKHRYATSPGGV